MRILVTGGTGFVGRYVVRRLRETGDEVLLYARASSDTREAVDLGAAVFTADLQDLAAVRAAVAQVDAVVHLGEIELRVKNAGRLNVEVVQSMIEAARQAPRAPRLVLVSSLTVVAPPAVVPADEQTPARVAIRDAYTAYKRGGEQALLAASIPATIVRAGTIYGPGAGYLLWFTRWLRRLRFAGLPFPGRLDAILPFIHVADLTEILVAAGKQPGDDHHVYHAVDDAGCSPRRFVALLSEAAGERWRLRSVPLFLQRALAGLADGLLGLFGLPPNARAILDFLSYDLIYRNDRVRNELGIRLTYPTVDRGVPGLGAWLRATR